MAKFPNTPNGHLRSRIGMHGSEVDRYLRELVRARRTIKRQQREIIRLQHDLDLLKVECGVPF